MGGIDTEQAPRVVTPSFYNQGSITPRENNRGLKIFDEAVEDFLRDSYDLAQQIAKPNNNKSNRRIGSVEVKHYFFVAPVPIPVAGSAIPVRQRTDQPNSALRVVAGVAGAVCGGYALFKLGQSFQHIKQAGNELDTLKEFKGRIVQWNVDWNTLRRTGNEKNSVLEKIEKIAECRKNIFSRIRRKSHLDVALLVGVVAAAVLAIVGAVIASWPILVAALAVGATAGGAMLLKWGLDSAAKGHDKDAKEIEKNVKELWKLPSPENIAIH